MEDDPNNFDDPALKAAIHKLRAGHQAPLELRQRIARQIAARDTAPIPIRPATTPLVKFITSIAAIVIVGFLGYVVYSTLYPSKPHYAMPQAGYPVNDNLLKAMVAMHAGPDNAGCKPLAASISDPLAIAAEATSKLGRPVPVIQLPGWTIDAATLCSFDSAPGARIHLTRQGQSITVVSVPAAAYAANAHGNYEKTIDGLPIAGAVVGPSLNCVVADASFDLKQVAALRDQILGLHP